MTTRDAIQLLIKLLVALLLLFPAITAATVVRFQTTLGVIDIQLYDAGAPLTVENFLRYVETDAYNYSFIHRSVPNFVVQGGGYVWDTGTNAPKLITTFPPVVNEFSPNRSNVRGTIAMAKLGGDPDSATSQWFFNLADNSANLDVQNGGFTVFGQVIGEGMTVVDTIAALQRVNTGGAFTQLPIANQLSDSTIRASNLVIILRASSNRTAIEENDSDRLFAYLEAAYPQFLAPANALASAGAPPSATFENYYYRYYPDTNAYIATANGALYYLGPASNNQIISLGTLAEWLAKAIAAGY